MKTRRSAALAALTAAELVIVMLIAVLINNSKIYNGNYVDLNSDFKAADLKEYTRVSIVPDFVSYAYDESGTKASYLLGITDEDYDFKYLVRLVDAEGTIEDDTVIEGHLVKAKPSSDMFKKLKKEGFNFDEAGSLLLPYSIVQTPMPSVNGLWTILGISGGIYLLLFIILVPKHKSNPS